MNCTGNNQIELDRIASIEINEAEISKGGIERCISKAWYLGDCVCILCIVQRTFCTRSTTACWRKYQNYHVFAVCLVCVHSSIIAPVHCYKYKQLFNANENQRYYCMHATLRYIHTYMHTCISTVIRPSTATVSTTYRM